MGRRNGHTGTFSVDALFVFQILTVIVSAGLFITAFVLIGLERAEDETPVIAPATSGLTSSTNGVITVDEDLIIDLGEQFIFNNITYNSTNDFIGPQGATGAAGAQGPAGPTGPQGNGTEIFVEEEGTLVSNGHYAYLNFEGSTITAVDAGAGRVNITVDAMNPAGTVIDNAVCRFDGTTGNTVQDSAMTIDDNGNVVTTGTINGRNLTDDATHLSDSANPHSVTKTQIGLANVENTKVNFAATAAPTTSDDDSEGYSVGSTWIDITNDKGYVCVDATTDSAVWIELTSVDSGGDVDGPASATDNAVARYDTTTGKLLQDSLVTIDDRGNIATPGTVDGRDISADAAHFSDSANPHSVTKTQVGLSEVENLKVNLAATTAPTATDDSGSSYSVGSRWIDVTNDKEYVCVDATSTTAVWIETTQTPPTIVFGTAFQETSEETESTTALTSFQQKIRLTTPSLTSGTYRIGWYCNFGNSGATDRTEVTVDLNDGTELALASDEPDAAANDLTFSGFIYQSSMSGVNTIDLEYRAIAGTASINHARLEIWRIS